MELIINKMLVSWRSRPVRVRGVNYGFIGVKLKKSDVDDEQHRNSFEIEVTLVENKVKEEFDLETLFWDEIGCRCVKISRIAWGTLRLSQLNRDEGIVDTSILPVSYLSGGKHSWISTCLSDVLNKNSKQHTLLMNKNSKMNHLNVLRDSRYNINA